MPELPRNLFCSYLAGLFDAEGQIILGRKKSGQWKIRQIIIHSINRRSLELISRKMCEFGAKSSVIERKRRNKPNLHYELRIFGRPNLAWFVENAGRLSHLARKRNSMNSEYLPRITRRSALAY